MRRDPFADPRPLIRSVYAYVAYRIGDGPEAEDVTSETFERALRYRDSYDGSRAEPVAWLIGIARHCIADALAARRPTVADPPDVADDGDLEEETVRRLALGAAVARLEAADRELIALRYGADLTVPEMAELTGNSLTTMEGRLYRALRKLRAELGAIDF